MFVRQARIVVRKDSGACVEWWYLLIIFFICLFVLLWLHRTFVNGGSTDDTVDI